MTFNSQLRNMGILSKNINSRKSSIMKPSANKIFSPDIETLWNDLKRLYDKRTELDPKFSFNKMVFEIHKLLGEGKAVAAVTIRNFYLRRTNPRKNTIKAIQRWIDEEKKEIVNHEDDENKNKEIDDSDNIINNSDSKEE
jgi:hypothetical protein